MNSERSKLRQPSKVTHQPLKEINFEKSTSITMNKVAGEEAKQLKRKASSVDAPNLPVPSVATRQKSSITKAHSDTGIHKSAVASTTMVKPRTTASATVSTRTAGSRSSTLSKSTNRSSNSQFSRSSATTAKPVELAMVEKSILPDIKKKKRAAWDTKGRLEDMEEAYTSLIAQLQEKFSETKMMQDTVGVERARVRELEYLQKQLESKLEDKEIESKEILRKYTVLQSELETRERREKDAIEALKSCHRLEVQQLELSKVTLEKESIALIADVKKANEEAQNNKNEILQLKSIISQQSTSYLAIESDNRALNHKLERTEDILRAREKYIVEIETKLENCERLITQLDQKIRDEETTRRKLHNTIQELKGNIRVFCRIRPLLEFEKDIEGGIAKMEFPDQDGKEIQLQQSLESSLGSSAKTIPFSFDRVFQSNTTQMEVFEEISQLIQSALDGYNVCIFAYGQTGSGKTYTMEGPNNPASDTIGMIPRAVQQIYDISNQLKSKGWQYTMEGQFLEIYNEAINDLLGCNTEFDKKKHEIKHEKLGRTTVTDITTVILDSPSKVTQLLKKAAANRAVGATNMNERSSRSHSVFTLRLNGYNNMTEEFSHGVLNLIDLAGSERLSSSGSTGDRLKETQAINKSLSCLGDVISALATQKEGGHVPYRNSKLTYLLQNSLGGNSKTLMFVNISPLGIHLQETLCSLRFATKVNSCQIGTATMKKSSKN